MRPLTMLLGIAMGSAIALLAGLLMTLAVFVLLPEYADRLAGERQPLFAAVGWAGLFTGTAIAAFVGNVRQRGWRGWGYAGLLLALAGIAWQYWPRGMT